MPEISVVIPTYNMARYVGQAVQSVLDQTYDDFEVIVVDDGSTDDTRDVVAVFDDPRVRYVAQENRERSAARNSGIRHARGAFVAFLDADDRWLPDKLDLQRAVFRRRPQLGLVYTGAYVMEDDRIFVEHRPVHRGRVVRPLLLEDNIIVGSGSAAMVRRECFDKVGLFDESSSVCEDWDMWLRIAAVYEVDFVDRPLVKIRVHALNTQKQARRMADGTRDFFERVLADPRYRADLQGDQQRVRSLAWFLSGRAHYVAREMNTARRFLLRSLRADPRQVRAWEYLARSLLGPQLTEVARAGRNWLRHALRYRKL